MRQITTPSGVNNPSTMGKIIDMHTQINSDPSIKWFTGATGTGIPDDAVDLQSLVLHEFGHWLKLKDLSQFENTPAPHPTKQTVMFSRAQFGSAGCKRRLDTPETRDDRYGFQYLYQLEFR